MAHRPNLNFAIDALLRHLQKNIPEFKHLQPRRIIVVAGEARRASRAAVKPLAFVGGRRTDALGRRKPLVRIRGRRALYAITLRPLFFRRSTSRQRVATLVHELFHISLEFDGTLDHTRRHASMGATFARAFKPLERRVWKSLPEHLAALFAHNGDVRILQWLERPSAVLPQDRSRPRTRYTEKQLFEGLVRMKTATR